MQNKKKANWGSLARLLRFLWQDYKLSLSIAFVLIVVASLATVNLTASIQSLVDVYVQPMLKSGSHDFGPLLRFLTSVAVFCLIGVIANYVSSLLMATISQDSLRSLRNQLFARMQKLPVRYFDTHQHGDIMSIYTNDIDALCQAVEQSIPQLLQTAITLIGVTVTMLTVSPLLFIVVLVMVGIMFMVIKNVSAKSGRYFGEQQKNLGIENGFIEEMMSGQKVVKAFVHEEESMADFDKINEQLFESSYLANRYANVLMPILGNLGNVSFVLTALVGGLFALNGVGGLTIGGLMAFLQLNRSFNGPITQVSQQLNFVLMALAGADRIFDLLDEPEEIDQGKVTLVNYELVDGQMVVTDKKTNLWAWKHPRPNGDYELVELVGNVVFQDVDFSYDGKKQILHDVNLYADKGQKVAFVGATGAGKTTITNLINRFYDIQSGVITYDGIDVKLIEKILFVAHLVSCFKIPISSRELSLKILPMVVPMRHARKFLKQPVLLTWIPLCNTWIMGMTLFLQMTVQACPMGNVSLSPLRVLPLPMHRFLSLTRRHPLLTLVPKNGARGDGPTYGRTYGFRYCPPSFNHCQF